MLLDSKEQLRSLKNIFSDKNPARVLVKQKFLTKFISTLFFHLKLLNVLRGGKGWQGGEGVREVRREREREAWPVKVNKSIRNLPEKNFEFVNIAHETDQNSKGK